MKKAIIIQNKFIGDVLTASVIANNLKKLFPEIIVHFFCYDKAIGVLEKNPNVDKIISFNDLELKKITNLKYWAKKIKAEKYDILIDPYAKIQSRYLTYHSKARYRISFDKPFFNWIYTHNYKEISEPEFISCTSIEDRILLLKPFFNNTITLDYRPKMFLSSEEISVAKLQIKDIGIDVSKPILMLGVMGSEAKKTWNLDYMATLIDFINDNYNFSLLFNYVPNQQKEVDLLISMLKNKNNIYIGLLGNSVREFAAIMANCTAIIGNEGGAINIAKSLYKPTFAIFSPNILRKNWGCFEHEAQHKSVHLMDIEPNLYTNGVSKDMKRNTQDYYLKITPDFVLKKVAHFIQNNNLNE